MQNKVTRTGIFETNSSSTHSITINGGSFTIDKLPVEHHTCEIYPGQFGWGYEKFNDSTTKASYALTWIKEMEFNYKAAPVAVEDWLAMLTNVIESSDEDIHCVTFVQIADNDYKWGYIDHQSIEDGGGVGSEIFESEENLRNFIFNPKSILIIDNDNRSYDDYE